jgi:hypothetical protein
VNSNDPKVKEVLGIPQDEPIFVLRGRDVIAAVTVKFWIELALGRDVPAEKIGSATAILRAFEDFKKANPGSMKQPD